MQSKPKKDVSSMLRDKYITTQLKQQLVLTPDYPLLDMIGGISYLKPSIQNYIYNPLFRSQDFTALGIKPPSTLLLYGVAGVGKTYLVNCISHHYKIPIVRGNIESPKDIRELFRKASLLDRAIVFLDDVDRYKDEDDKDILLQINENMSLLKGPFILISTAKSLSSVPESLAKFDNNVLVRIPTVRERSEILEQLGLGIKHGISSWSEIAKLTPGYVIGDLCRLLKQVASYAVAQNASQIEILHFNEILSKKVEITFDTVGALENVKEELQMSIILPSKFPEKFLKMGINKPSGILLHGPPGCGKTLLARAVSNMSHCNFISIKGPELISKYVGDSEREIRRLFDRAKQLQPCVLFFDEIDSLCSTRGKNEFGNRIVNQILTLLDGLDDRGEVYLIGATNRIGSIDKAMLRPGRFDKVIQVPLPSRDGCVDIFKKCITNIPVAELDFEDLELEGLSGAEISGLVREAAVLCLKENFDSNDLVIKQRHFVEALRKAKSRFLK